MADWIDSNSLITPSRTGFRFSIVPGFWTLLDEKVDSGDLRSSIMVLSELRDGDDQLSEWASERQNGMFEEPSEEVQRKFSEIADWVHSCGRYFDHHISSFLDKADPMLIAHAAVDGGRVVTLEISQPDSKKPKIPDVAAEFGVECINIWDLLDEWNASF